jgi:hypothetical protein
MMDSSILASAGGAVGEITGAKPDPVIHRYAVKQLDDLKFKREI